MSPKARKIGLFLGFNGALLLLFCALIISPLVSHFVSRSEDISDSLEQIARLRHSSREAHAIAKRAPSGVLPFLTGQEERIISADLQANVQGLAAARGLRVLGVRGLQGGQLNGLRTVVVSLELEGATGALSEFISAIEAQTPFLLIRDASLRTAVDGDDSLIRAELKIEGPARDVAGPALASSDAIDPRSPTGRTSTGTRP